MNFMNRKTILLQTMFISPTLGSESSVAWNHVKFMSNYHDIHVLYGASNPKQLGDITEMDTYLRTNKVNNVVFHSVVPGRGSKVFVALRKRVEKIPFLRKISYIAYHYWHKDAYKYAKELVKEVDFDCVHFLGPIGYREAGQLWKLGLPYMRGPVGGTYQRPKSLFKVLNLRSKILFYTRDVINWAQLNFSVSLRRSFCKIDVLLTTTTRVQYDFEKVHHKKSILLPENSVAEIHGLNASKFEIVKENVQLIWVGSIDARKALILLLEALSKCCAENYTLNVVGPDGGMQSHCENFLIKNNIHTNVIFHGTVPRNQVFEMMNNAHLHVICSLSEGHPTTQWEAMSVGLPTLTLDHCGMGDIINDKCGYKIAISTYKKTIADMSKVLQNVFDNPKQLVELGESTIKEAENHTWEKRVGFFNDLYSKF